MLGRFYFDAPVKCVALLPNATLRPTSRVRAVFGPVLRGADVLIQFLVLALHLVQDDRMQRFVACVGRRVILASPSPETNLLNRIDIRTSLDGRLEYHRATHPYPFPVFAQPSS
jgi:hypothetical protein